jgi:hypothetical protein
VVESFSQEETEKLVAMPVLIVIELELHTNSLGDRLKIG